MNMLRIFIAILLSIFSTVVMTYIALAASIGPFIETTLVLCSMFLFHSVIRRVSSHDYVQSVGLTTAAGGIGGILATGLAFSLPTLYFLSPTTFQTWMQNPFYFASVVTSFCFAAGSYGLLMANLFEDQFLLNQQMKFPLGELVYNAIAAPGQLSKSLELALGFCGTQLVLLCYKFSAFAGPSLILLQRISWSIFTLPAIVVPFDQMPMYLAVGFVTGHVIAIPLVVGFLAKVICLDPLFYLYTHTDTIVHKFLFASYANAQITNAEFVLAFCSGMILFGSIMGFVSLFGSCYKALKRLSFFMSKKIKSLFSTEHRFETGAWIQSGAALMISGAFLYCYKFSMIQQFVLVSLMVLCIYAMVVFALRIGVISSWGFFPMVHMISFNGLWIRGTEAISFLMNTTKKSFGKKIPWLQCCVVIAINVLFLSFFKFTILQQIYLLVFSIICIYQMLIIAGRMGIIPLGRFATFVMVPGMFLFNFDFVQVTFVAAFVEIAGGVAGDVLFGRRMAMLAKINHKQIVLYQWIGLVVCSLVVGIIFWLFIHNLGIGQEAGLPATKAASRALLIAFKSFDWYVLVMGFVFGYLIKYIKVNPALLLGGILMPPTISVMLIIGGLLTYLTKDKERYYPFLSGVSAGNSIWMLAETLIKIVR